MNMTRKSFTLAEVLLATFILVVVGAVLVSMVASSSIALQRTRSTFQLASHASSIFEHINTLNRTNLYSQRNNSTYWNDLIQGPLDNQTISLTNLNPADTGWLDDPLGVMIEFSWYMRGYEQNETYLSYFTYDYE